MKENYLIIGDDEYISQKETSKIKEKFLSSGEEDLNYSIHDPSDIEGTMNSLGTMPFLAERRVVVLKEAGEFSSEVMDTILSYLEKPLDTSVLVILAGDTFKKTKHYRQLSKLLSIVNADNPTPVTIKSWIRTFFKKEGLQISPAAVDLIVELKGTDTPAVKMEIEKLLSFSGGNKIEIEDVEELVGRSVTETVFKLVDAINSRNSKWAFRILNDLYGQKKQPQEIIGYLSWYMRVMQKVKLLSGKGSSLDQIARELKYSPAYTRRLSGQAEKYSASRIYRWVQLLLETDRDIKTGGKQAQLALEMLLVNFIKS